MDTAQEQRKRKLGTSESTSGPIGADVFDQMGNDGLKAHVDQARQLADPEELSVLSLVEADLEGADLAVEDEEEAHVVAAPEVEEEPVVLTEGAVRDEEPIAASEAEVQQLDARELGSSDLAKEEALGAEGEQAIEEAVAATAATLGGGALDDVAMKLIGEQVRDDLEVEDIVEARKDGRIDALVQGSLRRNALRSRDEVIFLLQQLVHEDGDLREMLLTTDPGTLAVDLVEYLAVMLVELDDLYALAAYDHADILKKVVIGDDALNAQKTLSPLALRMGGFATVMYQLVVDELALHPLPHDPNAVGEQDPTALVDPFGENLMSLVALFRQFRTASA